jgi:hypothetical protein
MHRTSKGFAGRSAGAQLQTDCKTACLDIGGQKLYRRFDEVIGSVIILKAVHRVWVDEPALDRLAARVAGRAFGAASVLCRGATGET